MLSIRADLALQTQRLQDETPCPHSQSDCHALATLHRKVAVWQWAKGVQAETEPLAFIHSTFTKPCSVPACVSHQRCSRSSPVRAELHQQAPSRRPRTLQGDPVGSGGLPGGGGSHADSDKEVGAVFQVDGTACANTWRHEV